MNLLDKLEMLMKNKGINKRQLSIGSDIPYSTIDNLWKKGYENIKLSTLKKIASFFDVSLDFLVDGVQQEPSAIPKYPSNEQIEKASDNEVSEADVERATKQLIDFLVGIGKLQPGEDISERDAEILLSVISAMYD